MSYITRKSRIAAVAMAIAAVAGAALGWQGRARADVGPAVTWIESSAGAYWQTMPSPQIGATTGGALVTLSVSPGQTLQQIAGFGGCVNEDGWAAIQTASAADQANIMNGLFGASGCNFNMARVPIGANDFSQNPPNRPYSDDDGPSDPTLKNFSIARDKQSLIPFLKAAQQVQPNLQAWGVPWSPPAWMKTNGSMIGGSINATPQILTAYANYLTDWAQAYQAQGIPIMAIAPQNEPENSSNYPTCTWTAAQLDTFIGSYLGPTLRAKDPNVQLWLGTLYDDGNMVALANTTLTDPTASPFVSGVALQYTSGADFQSLRQSNPGLTFLGSEAPALNAANSWGDGLYLFGDIWSDLKAGANSYFMWNMVLSNTPVSTGGWYQDSMITVNQTTGQVTYNPYYYVMRHFSEFVQPGAHEVSSTGYTVIGSSGFYNLAFVNPDGSTVIVVGNNSASTNLVAMDIDGQEIQASLAPQSISTFLIATPEPGTVGIALVAAGGFLLRRKPARRL